MKKESVSLLADACVIAVTAALAVRLFFGSVLSVLLPFALAYAVARVIHRPAEFISKKSKIPVGIVSTVMVAAVIIALCAAVWVGLNKLMTAAGGLLGRFAGEENGIGNALEAILSRVESITSVIPAFDGLRKNETLSRVCNEIDEFVHSSAREFLEGMSNDIGNFVGTVIKALPETFLYILVTIIASVYICSQMKEINGFLLSLIPKKHREKFTGVWKNIISALKAYLKAYSLIYLITFAELLFGFALMRMRNGFILALIIAIVDILPVFGVGAVLLPWALTELTVGNARMFANLLILYLVITAVRQFAEPKIVGRSIGLNPLVTLLAMFSGYKLFGVLGMVGAPIAAVALFAGRKYNSGEKSD